MNPLGIAPQNEGAFMMIPVEIDRRDAKEYNELDVKNMFEKNKGVLTKKYFRPRKVFLKPWGVIQRNKVASMMIPVGKEHKK